MHHVANDLSVYHFAGRSAMPAVVGFSICEAKASYSDALFLQMLSAERFQIVVLEASRNVVGWSKV